MILAYRDSELGYVDEDYGEVLDCSPEWCGIRDCTGQIHEGRHVVPVSCSVCGGDIPEDADYPLCSLHEGSSREGGRALAEQQRYERDVGGRGK